MQKIINVTKNEAGNFIIELDPYSAETYILDYEGITNDYRVPAWSIDIMRDIKFGIEKVRNNK